MNYQPLTKMLTPGSELSKATSVISWLIPSSTSFFFSFCFFFSSNKATLFFSSIFSFHLSLYLSILLLYIREDMGKGKKKDGFSGPPHHIRTKR